MSDFSTVVLKYRRLQDSWLQITIFSSLFQDSLNNIISLFNYSSTLFSSNGARNPQDTSLCKKFLSIVAIEVRAFV
jgi:hypothetical protein